MPGSLPPKSWLTHDGRPDRAAIASDKARAPAPPFPARRQTPSTISRALSRSMGARCLVQQPGIARAAPTCAHLPPARRHNRHRAPCRRRQNCSRCRRCSRAAPSLAGSIGILPARFHQRAADEHNRRDRIEEPKGRLLCRRHKRRSFRSEAGPASAARHGGPPVRAISAIPGPRSGWRGAISVNSREFRIRTTAMRRDYGVILAWMRAGGAQHRATGNGSPQHAQLVRVCRWRRHVEFEVSGQDHSRRAQFAECPRIRGITGEAEVELLQQRRDCLRRAPPAPERAFRQTGGHSPGSVGCRARRFPGSGSATDRHSTSSARSGCQ